MPETFGGRWHHWHHICYFLGTFLVACPHCLENAVLVAGCFFFCALVWETQKQNFTLYWKGVCLGGAVLFLIFMNAMNENFLSAIPGKEAFIQLELK